MTFQELAVRLNYNDPSGAEKAYKNALRKLKANLYSGAYGQWIAIRKVIDRAKAEADSGSYATLQTTWTDEKKQQCGINHRLIPHCYFAYLMIPTLLPFSYIFSLTDHSPGPSLCRYPKPGT